MLPDAINCTGCGSCAVICPKKCITMVPDCEGFRYPQIDNSKCIHCGLCEKGCPIIIKLPRSSIPDAIAAQNKNDSIRLQSSSGGIFTSLACDILAHGGRVCAAVYNSDFTVNHAIAKSIQELSSMRSAKYIQSRCEHCFPEIQFLLQQGLPVLFVGTPCQVAGLRRYLKKDYNTLLLADIICHGVPSPKIWTQYLSEKASGRSIYSINLRDKSTGWSRYHYSVKIDFCDGTSYCIPQSQDLFMRGFVSNLYLRPSCSACHFKGLSRYSDITLGDYWGIWDQHPTFDDNKGTSLLLIHTEKGRNAWIRISKEFQYLQVDAHDAVAQNPSALYSSPPHPKRTVFFTAVMQHKPLQLCIDSCIHPNKPTILQRIIRIIQKRQSEHE